MKMSEEIIVEKIDIRNLNICPLLIAGFLGSQYYNSLTVSSGPLNCFKEGCALWNKASNCCGLVKHT